MNAKRVVTHEEYKLSDDEYEELLDEIYGDVEICGIAHYSSGRALKELDPIAFRCGKSDNMQWKCTECEKIYENESDAEDCCEKWKCSDCGLKFDDEDEADECCKIQEEDKE